MGIELVFGGFPGCGRSCSMPRRIFALISSRFSEAAVLFLLSFEQGSNTSSTLASR